MHPLISLHSPMYAQISIEDSFSYGKNFLKHLVEMNIL